METKRDEFLKEAGILSKEFQLKIERAEMEAEKQRVAVQKKIEKLKEEQVQFDKDLEELKETPVEEFETKMEVFKKKHEIDGLFDNLDEKFGEITEKTKSFFSGLGNKVSDFYHKQVEKKDNKKNEPEQL